MQHFACDEWVQKNKRSKTVIKYKSLTVWQDRPIKWQWGKQWRMKLWQCATDCQADISCGELKNCSGSDAWVQATTSSHKCVHLEKRLCLKDMRNATQSWALVGCDDKRNKNLVNTEAFNVKKHLFSKKHCHK